MSAILSADDLNDFISPGVACIKPIETLPKQRPEDASNTYEVTTEERVAASNPPPAQISLTDCLACSGCVTSAEAVLVSLQSHSEVLNTLDAYQELSLPWPTGAADTTNGTEDGVKHTTTQGKLFVASVSPQVRASLAATYGVTERETGHMISQLLSGPQGLRSGGRHGSGFIWVLDTNVVREAALVAAANEVTEALGAKSSGPKRPILTSACPGWICYAEKTHPHILPHLSQLKSPQALAGTLVKSVLAQRYGISPDRVFHVAVMPCFDKKLEASREELTDVYWKQDEEAKQGVRDVDCVITARELLMLADSRGISFPALPRRPLSRRDRIAFPDPQLDAFLFPRGRRRSNKTAPEAGSSGGYLWHVMQTYQSQHPGSSIHTQRGRNADVIKVGDVAGLRGAGSGIENGGDQVVAPAQKEWLARVDEAYFSASDSGSAASDEDGDQEMVGADDGVEAGDGDDDVVDGISTSRITAVLNHWAQVTGVELEKLLYTTYRKVESDVGKKAVPDMERVAGLASSIGGGW
ncbi:Cytosolic Fe-S cluster assembly factor nar1 [Cryomyces antarcticus]|uniref:Nuclear architecture-related protein 1 n=1 Tax=Cryomyces antarcticus TaxID=329879 RepID=A0ABR0KU30_9PEZI|nr:Cytosolic Fe-S cluster assembly factor nar1 [Cryomyces antarcticus]KAK5125869.1 Cytosolic Fe-S cluster assembly factor nar1 [Cryomyces antarcticus]